MGPKFAVGDRVALDRGTGPGEVVATITEVYPTKGHWSIKVPIYDYRAGVLGIVAEKEIVKVS